MEMNLNSSQLNVILKSLHFREYQLKRQKEINMKFSTASNPRIQSKDDVKELEEIRQTLSGLQKIYNNHKKARLIGL